MEKELSQSYDTLHYGDAIHFMKNKDPSFRKVEVSRNHSKNTTQNKDDGDEKSENKKGGLAQIFTQKAKKSIDLYNGNYMHIYYCICAVLSFVFPFVCVFFIAIFRNFLSQKRNKKKNKKEKQKIKNKK